MSENKNIIVAIDGHSSCGKSTLAKQLADHFHFIYIDTGAMYRCVTLLILEQNISLTDHSAIEKLMFNTKIYFKKEDGKQHTFLNGRNVTEQIRDPKVSNLVSEVAAISQIRSKLVEQQRIYAIEDNLIMDGRDIGTVVYPDADLKIYLTASEEIRAKRRYAELLEKGIEISFPEVLANIEKRDRIDSTREDSPLRKADDALVLDNTLLNQSEQFQQVKVLIEQILERNQ